MKQLKDFLRTLIGIRRLERLEPIIKTFDPKKEYPGREGKEMTKRNRALEVGRIVKLVDMLSVNSCDDDDVWIRVIKHTMVLIDALKYRLDYEQSFTDNKIGELYKQYGIR